MKKEEFLSLLMDDEEYIFEEITKPIFSREEEALLEELSKPLPLTPLVKEEIALLKPLEPSPSTGSDESVDAVRQNMEALWNNPILKEPLQPAEKENTISEEEENTVKIKSFLIDLGSILTANIITFGLIKSRIIYPEIDLISPEWSQIIPVISLTYFFWRPLSHKVLTKIFDAESASSSLGNAPKIKDLLYKIKSENKNDPLKTQEEMLKESLSNGKEISSGENNFSCALENIKEIL